MTLDLDDRLRHLVVDRNKTSTLVIQLPVFLEDGKTILCVYSKVMGEEKSYTKKVLILVNLERSIAHSDQLKTSKEVPISIE